MSDNVVRRRMMVDNQIRPSDVTKFPIIEAVHGVLYQQKPVRKVMAKLCDKLD